MCDVAFHVSALTMLLDTNIWWLHC